MVLTGGILIMLISSCSILQSCHYILLENNQAVCITLLSIKLSECEDSHSLNTPLEGKH
jgi:hypothetical protein